MRNIRRPNDASPASKIRIMVGAPVAGSVSVSAGTATAPVAATTGGVTTGCGTTAVVPVATITALGFGGADRDDPDRVAEVVNSRIESTPALIVISVVERADVIVTTYDAPALRVPAVVITAIAGEDIEPVIDATLMLSLVA